MLIESGVGAELGPVLSDGTRVADLIDVDRREILLRVLHDPEIHQLELDRLFARAWILVAHESEIPNRGDYVTRYIGEDPVIVTRDDDGEIQILLNVCQHRGAIVCRADVGSATTFRCIYHGWTYDQHGRFLGAPVSRERMQGDVLTKSALSLPRARAETCVGMIFGTFDELAPSLEHYLGDIKWYLELMWDRSDSGMEVIGPPGRWVVDANWKCAGEQFAGDGYHTYMLHRSLFELGWFGDEMSLDASPGGYGIDISTPEGHGLRCVPSRDTYAALIGEKSAELTVHQKLEALPPPGMSSDMLSELEGRFDPDQLRLLADAPPSVGGLFPNVASLNFYAPTPDGHMAASTSWHVFVPRGPDRFEFYSWTLVERDAPEEIRRMARQLTQQQNSASGTIEQDDAEVWPSMSRSARGSLGRRQTLKYQALLGENKPEDWPGGGLIYEGFSKDDNQWNWWKRYFEFMTSEPWSSSR